jgi:hypothetical protein
MSYQNINQYNFKRWYLVPVNEISDICLASDEKDYDQEVIFSPLLIGENDGNRMPFKFDFNNSATTICQTSTCNFSSDTIVSENYWNPLNEDPNLCPSASTLCNVGLTGIDNGLVKELSGETIDITTGLYLNTEDKFSRYKYDRRMKLHPITGFTTTQNRLWDDGSYNYNLIYNTDNDSVGYYARLNGGFFQGFYKLAGYEYEVFPERPSLGWTSEILLRYRWTGNTDIGLNKRYPENKGTFFFMGARAENKFYHYADGSPITDSGYTRVTEGLNCMDTCECGKTGKTNENSCYKVYQQSGITSTNCSCSCSCNCNSKALFPELDPLYDGVSNALSLRLSGDTGNPKLCVKTYRITGSCEPTSACTTEEKYVTGTTLTEWCSTRGIFDSCENTTYTNVEHWVQINTVFERNEWFDTCDLLDKGGLGLIIKTVYTASTANNSVSLIEPPTTHEKDYDPATTEVVNFNENWTEEQKYRLGKLKFYVNGRLFMVAENFEEIIPRLLNTPKEKQIGVSYNISIGGGTQGLHDNLTFSGGCPSSLNEMVYQQDPECLTTQDLDNTIYSGLTTNIKLEEYFGGSLIGDISAFRMYTEPLNASQIKHNFKILKNKYNLLDVDCVNCSIQIPENDLTYNMYICASPTPTQTPTNTQTPTESETPTPTQTETPTNTPSQTPTNTPTETLTETPTNTPTETETSTPTPTETTTETPTNTPTETPTETPTNTPTETPTETPTNTPTESETPTPTQTETPTNTPTESETPTPTQTETPTETPTKTPTETPTNTPTESETSTPTQTETPTETPTKTPTETPTETPTNTPTETPTNTPTESETPTPTQTETPTETPTNTPTETPTETPTNTPTESETPTLTQTETPTNTPTESETPTPTQTETPTNTPTESETPTPTQTETPTNTPTESETPTSTQTETPTNTPTESETPTPTQTETPTNTPTESETPTPTQTETPTNTPTESETPTPTQTETPTNTPTESETPTPTQTETPTPTPTETETPTPTPTETETPTPTPTETETPTPTPTETPTETPTNTPSETHTQTPTNSETPTNTPTTTPTPTPEGFLLQENFFRIDQEDGFGILITT